jgi:hypothetical protein
MHWRLAQQSGDKEERRHPSVSSLVVQGNRIFSTAAKEDRTTVV